jgi:alanine dehydrogenase
LDTRTLLLSRSDVVRCIGAGRVVEIVEQVFRAHGEGRVVMPAKVTLDMSPLGLHRSVNAMPAYVQSQGAYGIKWIGGFVDNPARYGLPYIMAVMVINDPESGVPLAIMDAVEVTAFRTGASAAVAAKYLAARTARVAAFVGCGQQGRAALTAVKTVLALSEVRAYDVKRSAAETLAQEAESPTCTAIVCDDLEGAANGADIIVTATLANEPLVRREWVKPGGLVVKLGSFQELADELTLGADRMVVDHRQQCEHRGELPHLFRSGRMTQSDIDAELGDVVAGKAAGRTDGQQVIVATLIGMGSEDIAVGAEVYRQAVKKGLGARFGFLD